MAATDGAEYTDTYSTTHGVYGPQAGTVATFLFTGVQVMTLIVDGEQCMVELHMKDRVHRFTTESAVARNGLVSALSRACGTR